MLMNCRAVKDQLPTYLEGDLPDAEARVVALHLATCVACRSCSDELGRSRLHLMASLRSLPSPLPPPTLLNRLRIAASYEIERSHGRLDFTSASRRWWMRARLTMHDLMQPLAVPAAGGLLSSIVCFVMLADTLGFPQQKLGVNDIPLGFTTQVQVDQLSPFGYAGRDVVVELTIDRDGHVANYAARGAVTRDDMKQLNNLILFTSFEPATVFGQPTSGKILLRSHRINVRG